MSRAVACLVGLSLISSPIFAGQIGGIVVPPPDGVFPPGGGVISGNTQLQNGASTIRGRVLAADTGQPLRRALVRVNSSTGPGGRTTTTDVDGRYRIERLPEGRYSVSVMKDGFVNVGYGQTRPSEPPKTIELTANQTLDNVDFSVPRAGVIAGRVVDEFGEPLANAQVMTARKQFLEGQPRIMPSGRPAMTDDDGAFRLFGLAPGRYYVSATLRGPFVGPFDAADSGTGYAPTYYPGTPDVAQAQQITVDVGETVNGINLQLAIVRTARISGTAYDANGQPLRAGMVMIIERHVTMNTTPGGGGPIRPDGSFVVSNVTPGDYVLQVPLGRPGPPPVGPGAPGAIPRFARATVTVNGSDVTDVVVAPVQPSTASGRIVIDPSGAGSLQTNALRILASPLQPDPTLGPMNPPAQVREDLTFDFVVPPGRLMIRPLVSGEWVVRAVRLNGAEVTDSGIEFTSGQAVEGIEVEITNHPPEISGIVTNARGDAVKDYRVVVFTQNQDLWATNARGFAVGRPDSNGRYRVRTLPADRYYAVALEALDPNDWHDPALLDRLKRDATPFSLQDAEKKTLDLRLFTSR